MEAENTIAQDTQTREEQIEKIYHSMKFKQKASLLTGNDLFTTVAIPKYGIHSIRMFDGPAGVRMDESNIVNEKDIKTTCFPAPSLVACSWDPEIAKSVGTAIGNEAAHFKVDMVLAPGANIKRNPLCGRNFEYFSEDPLLSGTMAAGYINGIQSVGVGACLKHFACNNQEYARMLSSSEVDMRALEEIYLKPFKIAIEQSNPWAVMSGYNKLRGIYCSENEWLISKTLRDEWNYKGVLISDWYSVLHPIASHNAGLDLEMPGCGNMRVKEIVTSVKNGTISPQKFEQSVKRMIDLSLKCGHYNDNNLSYNESYSIALKAAEESMVLAKNTKGILPLSNYDDCCIIGALAKNVRFQGCGAAKVNSPAIHSLMDFALTKSGRPVPYEAGYRIDEEEDEMLAFRAIDLASSKKKVILVLGLDENYDREGSDRPDMRLPDEQISLFKSIYSVNKNIIVIVCAGAPVELPFIDDAKAVLLTYLGGVATGEAIHNILLGKVNPCGKTAETWPMHYYDVPNYASFGQDMYHTLYKESIYVGYRYYSTAQRNVLFPFGHGLSYSKFDYSDLSINKASIKNNKPTTVKVTVTNNSKVAGKEIVQLYVGAKSPQIFKSKRELKGFTKIYLEPGEKKTVSFTLNYSDFSHYSQTTNGFEVEGGEYVIEIGASAADIRCSKTIEVCSPFKDNKNYLITLVPSYFNIERDREFNVMDYEFNLLLGHNIKTIRKRKYDWNSTLESYSKKRKGKKILDGMKKDIEESKIPQKLKKGIIAERENLPLRMVFANLGEKKGRMYIDFANHKNLQALIDALFYHRKR